MKRLILTTIFILTILISPTIKAGGVGITPVHYKVFFEPGLEKEFKFQSFNTDPTKEVNVYLEGDLAEYAKLSETNFVGLGSFTVKIKLPQKIEKPGTHHLMVGAIEGDVNEEGTVGGIASIRGRIDIIVPYPGQYIEAGLEVNDINENETSKYRIEIKNLGTDDTTVYPKIEIIKDNEVLITKNFERIAIVKKDIITLEGKLEGTENLQAGEYFVKATIGYGQNKTIEINKTLRVGEFFVEILDYDYMFEQGKISKFDIIAQNKWNTPINELHAQVSVTDEGEFLTSFKTPSTKISQWQVINLTGYLDATDLEAKRYTARIELLYNNKTTGKLVAIYVNEPTEEANYILYGIIAGSILILTIFILLMLKIHILNKSLKNRKNAKKK